MFLVLPILGIFGSLLFSSEESKEIFFHLGNTVLFTYINTTLLLILGVTLLTTSIGIITAWLIANYDFPGKKIYELVMIFPLAIPTYVMAYAYTDFLQYSNLLQNAIYKFFKKELVFSIDPRSLYGAICILSFALYPYVYLLCRTAFLERNAYMIDVARTLGANTWQSFWKITIPMTRPAIITGITLTIMEVISDYGTMNYFGIQTMTTSIYHTWFIMDQHNVALQISALLLSIVLFLLSIEHISRKKMRYTSNTQRFYKKQILRLNGYKAFLASIICIFPLYFGFILPIMILFRLAMNSNIAFDERYETWISNTLLLSGITVVLGLLISIFLAYSARINKKGIQQYINRIVNTGYAIPGTVLAVGILSLSKIFNISWLLSNSMLILIYAYLTRFLSPSLQTIEAGLTKITTNMDISAMSLGANRFMILKRIHFPLLKRSLITGSLLIFIDVMKELPLTLVLRPFNFDTLSVIAYQFATDERLSEASFPSLTIIAISLVPIVILSRFSQNK